MNEIDMEIKFKRDTSFRKQFFVPDSFAHPAKMDAQLLIWIVENYSVLGEVILDPMAGSGTMMLACTLGRHCILVELEEKFCKMMADNWAEVKMRPQLGSIMGDCRIIQVDARNLEGLPADKIISSPPYGNRLSDSEVDDGDPQGMSYRQALGKADKIITSPPYAENTHHSDNALDLQDFTPGRTGRVGGTAGNSVGQIGLLPYGNIDKIITSPPYEEGGQGQGKEYHPERMVGSEVGLGRGYPESAGNIGNLKGDTYLEAMALVYAQCFNALKDGGLMILVTKNFIRNKAVVRLDTDTIKLCEQVGFTYLERHFRKLPSQSFWRTIYHQKHPDVEMINYEDVLVFFRGL